MKNNITIIISGPTASGKTSTSISLAKKLKELHNIKTEIVNFDSLLFYKELTIGTAKPSKEELAAVPHHLINIDSAHNPLNASDYAQKAGLLIDKIHQQNKAVILTGGSGFYLRALIKGMFQGKKTSPQTKGRSTSLFCQQGISPFLVILKENDPQSFNELHPNDHYRIIRAVEYFWETGQTISGVKNELNKNDPYDFSKNIHPHWNIFHCYLDLPKAEHQKIIEERTYQMIKAGLVAEIKSLLNNDFTGKEKPLQSIGYKEIIAHILGETETLEDSIGKIIISTRQLAKSQRTFFKKIKDKHCYNPLFDSDQLLEDILEFIKT